MQSDKSWERLAHRAAVRRGTRVRAGRRRSSRATGGTSLEAWRLTRSGDLGEPGKAGARPRRSRHPAPPPGEERPYDLVRAGDARLAALALG
ncbi:hypothetical protein GCM10018952_34840 [Streptosporangium vulgare]